MGRGASQHASRVGVGGAGRGTPLAPPCTVLRARCPVLGKLRLVCTCYTRICYVVVPIPRARAKALGQSDVGGFASLMDRGP